MTTRSGTRRTRRTVAFLSRRVVARVAGGELAAIDWAGVMRLGWILVQLVLLGLIIQALRIESPVFADTVAPLVIAGAVVNHLLPHRYRLRFFALLSMVSLYVVFGLVNGTWLVAVGLWLIGICHLPIAFGLRVLLLVLSAATLAAMRAGALDAPWSNGIWAILGSMFMFRLIVYVYDLRHMKERTGWDQRIAYFFCLPNVSFPLFPVLDFATFRRTYYDRGAAEIYEQGVRWIVRGLVHLVLYRLVYQYGVMGPAEVVTGSDLVRYVVSNYGLYLRVSGQFHLVVGMLHLFGFRLPETHKFFFLASSFSDLWRRINIYWKDFMQKVFYMPVFFRLRRRHGETVAMVIATGVVFGMTWFLHSYQWFWILGTWLLSRTDALFWSGLAVCLVVNALWEARRGRVRTMGTARLSPARLAVHGAQTAAMFSVMCLLWALWTSPTLGGYVSLLTSPRFSPRDLAVIAGTVLLVAVAAALSYARAHATRPSLALQRGSTAAGFGVLAFVAFNTSLSPASYLPHDVIIVLKDAKDPRLNREDRSELQRGYYEKLVDVNRFNSELWRLYAERPAKFENLRELGAVRDTRDARLEELIPGVSIDQHGTRLTVNSAGLRDREYPLAKPAGVRRVAVLGQSYVMGAGVNDSETFENLLEERLNAGGTDRFEFINFGAPGYSIFQQLAQLELGMVEAWDPDVVMLVGHRNEFRKVADYLEDLESREIGELPGELAALWATAGLKRGMPRDDAQRRMAPHNETILLSAYRDAAALTRRMGALPVFAYIPTPLEMEIGTREGMLEVGQRSNFAAVLNLTTVYDNHDERALSVADWDRHPNARGHALIATMLYDQLAKRPDVLSYRRARPEAEGAGATRR